MSYATCKLHKARPTYRDTHCKHNRSRQIALPVARHGLWQFDCLLHCSMHINISCCRSKPTTLHRAYCCGRIATLLINVVLRGRWHGPLPNASLCHVIFDANMATCQRHMYLISTASVDALHQIVPLLPTVSFWVKLEDSWSERVDIDKFCLCCAHHCCRATRALWKTSGEPRGKYWRCSSL